MSKWSNIYEGQIAEVGSLEAFIARRLSSKQKLVELIKRYGAEGRRLLEAGCGSGITSTALALAGYHVEGIDADPDMVDLATKIALDQRSSAAFRVDDTRILATIDDHFDVVFSNGVMEHFSDDEIVAVVNRHLSIANFVIISVPSDYFTSEQRLYGDERFMGIGAWRYILSTVQGTIVEESSFDSAPPVRETPQFLIFVLQSRERRTTAWGLLRRCQSPSQTISVSPTAKLGRSI